MDLLQVIGIILLFVMFMIVGLTLFSHDRDRGITTDAPPPKRNGRNTRYSQIPLNDPAYNDPSIDTDGLRLDAALARNAAYDSNVEIVESQPESNVPNSEPMSWMWYYSFQKHHQEDGITPIMGDVEIGDVEMNPYGLDGSIKKDHEGDIEIEEL